MPAHSVPIAKKTQAIALALQGTPKGKIAEQLGVSRETVRKVLNEGEVSQVSRETSINRALARAGLTHESIAAKFAELMNAKDTRLASFEGKFTDRVDVPDNAVQHRATESIAKIAGMFPKEDATANAALFVKMPIQVLVPDHAPSCMCSTCARAWEAQTRDALTVLPEPLDNP